MAKQKIASGQLIKKEIKTDKPAFRPNLYLSGILILVALLYSKAVFNDFTYYDDDGYILHNPYLRDFSLAGIKAIFSSFYEGNYHPLTTLIWQVLFVKFGATPLPFHLLNAALHLLNTFLAYLFAKKLSGNEVTGLIVAVLFAVHPMHVESVTWISELKDVLYAAFFLSSLVVYFKFLETKKAKYYLITLLLFLCSLLSKTAAVTLPVVLIVVDLYKGRKLNTRLIIEKIPFLILSLVFGIITLKSQSTAMTNLLAIYGVVNRIFLFTSTLSFYLLKLVCPYPLSAIYFLPVRNGNFLPWYYYLSLPFLAGVIALIIKYRKNRDVVFGVAFFIITISVMLQVVAVGFAFAANRYTYIPYIGLFYLAAQFMVKAAGQRRQLAFGIFAVVIVIFSAISWQQIAVWQNSDTLFSDIVDHDKYNSDNCFIYWSWGNAKKGEGKLREAWSDYNEAILRYPRFHRAYYGRGEMYNALGNPKSALKDMDTAIALYPKFGDAYNRRGEIYYELGDTQAAINSYNKAITLKDDFFEKITFPEVYNNLGWTYYGMHDTASAIANYQKAISLSPDFLKPYYNLAVIRVDAGDFVGAIKIYNQVIARHPQEHIAFFNRGIMAFDLNDKNAACADWSKAAELGNAQAAQLLRQYCR